MLFSEHKSLRWVGFLVLTAFLTGVAFPSESAGGKLLAAFLVGAGLNYAVVPLFLVAWELDTPARKAFRAFVLSVRVMVFGAFVFLIAPVAETGLWGMTLGLALGVLAYCLVHGVLDYLRRHNHIPT